MRRLLPLALLFLGISPLFAAKEALLIANADYSHLGKLPNPVPDARQLTDVLRQIGFNVSIVENASREDMLLALGDFEERLRANRGIARTTLFPPMRIFPMKNAWPLERLMWMK